MPRRWPTLLVAPGVAIAYAALLGIAVGTKNVPLTILTFAPIALVVATALERHPRWTFYGSLLVLALIPMYGIPAIKTVGSPGLVGLWIVGLGGLTQDRRGRASLADWIVAAGLAGAAVSQQISDITLQSLATLAWVSVGPYLAARRFAIAGEPEVVLRGLVGAAAVAVPFLVVELVSANPFIRAFPSATQLPAYGQTGGIGVATERLGTMRTQGAFGQPIPFAMFLASATIAALSLWLARPPGRATRYLLVLAGILAVGQATALVRTGWIMLAGFAVLAVLLAGRPTRPSRKQALIGVSALIGIVGLAVGPTRSLLFGGGASAEQANLRNSADYRSQLLDAALEPGYIPAFGGPRDRTTSIDNAYVLLGLEWGYLPMFALLALLGLSAVLLWRHRGDALSVAIFSLMLLNLTALFGVALMTQGQSVVWLIVGLASGHAAALAGVRATAGLPGAQHEVVASLRAARPPS